MLMRSAFAFFTQSSILSLMLVISFSRYFVWFRRVFFSCSLGTYPFIGIIMLAKDHGGSKIEFMSWAWRRSWGASLLCHGQTQVASNNTISKQTSLFLRANKQSLKKHSLPWWTAVRAPIAALALSCSYSGKREAAGCLWGRSLKRMKYRAFFWAQCNCALSYTQYWWILFFVAVLCMQTYVNVSCMMRKWKA